LEIYLDIKILFKLYGLTPEEIAIVEGENLDEKVIMQKTNIRTIRVPWSRNERKIFGAFKWNPYVLGMYEEIFEKITNDPKWEEVYGCKWQVQYGSKFTFPTDISWKSRIRPRDIEEFILQNKQLYDIFVKGISSCDLFIADITHHNPNVMVELGIAVQQNKNILVVTSQDINDMEFDIRGLQATRYASKEDLQKLIEKQIEIYLTITGQVFEPGKFLSNKKYTPKLSGKLINKVPMLVHKEPKLKNLRIKMKFKFIFSTNNEFDWFGVYLRAQGPERYFSELVLIRFSGKTRSLTFPERRLEHDGKRVINFTPNDYHTLEILIEEKRIAAWVDDGLVIEDTDIIIDSIGEVWISGNDHHEPDYFNPKREGEKNKDGNYLEIEYKDIEILDLNTTANLYDKSGQSS